MKLLKILSTATLGMLALIPFGLSAQNVAPATVKAVKVTGDAKLDNAPLKTGEIFSQGKTIKTGPGARVLVRFSNGAAVSVRENSELKLTTFTQEPITTVKVATHEQIKSEPSKSNTQVTLSYGKVIARAHQMQAKGSKFEINTPTGAAGIRGSIAVVSYNRDIRKMIAASIQGTIDAKGNQEATWTPIREGYQIEITAVVDPQGNIISVSVVVDRYITDPDLIDILKDIGFVAFDRADTSIVSPSEDVTTEIIPTPTPPQSNL